MQQTEFIVQTIISLIIFIGFMFLEWKIQKKTLGRKITKITLTTIWIIAGMIFIAGVIKSFWK